MAHRGKKANKKLTKWMGKWRVVHQYDGILVVHKKEQLYLKVDCDMLKRLFKTREQVQKEKKANKKKQTNQNKTKN